MMIHRAVFVLLACAVSAQAGWFTGNGVLVQTVKCDNASSIIFTNPAGNLSSYVASSISNMANLSSVLVNGNDAGFQSATNFASISGTGSVVWGVGMSLDGITNTAYGASQAGYNPHTGTVTIAHGAYGAHQAVHMKGSNSVASILGDTLYDGAVGSLQRLHVYYGTATVARSSAGAHQYGRVDQFGLMSIGVFSIAADQGGFVGDLGRMLIGDGSYGASQRGIASANSLMSIGEGCMGASQHGDTYGTMEILDSSEGSMQRGFVRSYGTMTMGQGTHGSHQLGYVDLYSKMQIGDGARGAIQAGSLGRISTSGSQATNGGNGALQLFDLTASQVATTTADGDGSILLGAGTASNRYSVVAGDGMQSHGEGSITASGGFWHGENPALTNETDTLQTVVNRGSGPVTNAPYMVQTNATDVTFAGWRIWESGPYARFAPRAPRDGGALYETNGTTTVLLWNSTLRELYNADGVGVVDFAGDIEITTNLTVTGSITAGGGFYGPSATITATMTASNIVQTSGGWDDLLFPVSSIYAVGLTDIEYIPQSNSINFKATCNTNFASDNVWLVGQLSHSTKTNSAFISPHIHFIQTSATQTNVFFIRYKRYKIGEGVPPVWVDMPCTNNVLPYTSGTIHQIAEGANIDGPFGISENFDFKIWSRGGEATQLKFFDIHYQRDSLGSDLEFQKTF